MILLEKNDYPSALRLFKNSRHHMKLDALAEGRIEAQVWADRKEPSVAIVLYQNKLTVASGLNAAALAPILRPFLLEQAYEKHMAAAREMRYSIGMGNTCARRWKRHWKANTPHMPCASITSWKTRRLA